MDPCTMRLCDSDIIAALDAGRIAIDPRPDDRSISGVSVDLRLGHRFRVFSTHTIPFIDLSGSRDEVNQAVEKVMGDEIYIGPEDTFVLHPGELALGTTLESITLPDDGCAAPRDPAAPPTLLFVGRVAEEKGLVLSGPPGGGKTFLALAILLVVVDAVVPFLAFTRTGTFASGFLYWCIITFGMIVVAWSATRRWRAPR